MALRSPWSPTPGARLHSSPRHARMSVPWRRSVWITSAHSLAHAEWQTTPGGRERLCFSDSSGRLIGLRNPQTPRAGFPHGSGACRLPCEPPACRGGRKTVCVVGKVSPAEAGGSHAEVGAAGLRGTGRASAWELGCRSTAGFSQPPEHRSLLWQTAALTASRRKAKKMPLPLCWKSFWFLDG